MQKILLFLSFFRYRFASVISSYYIQYGAYDQTKSEVKRTLTIAKHREAFRGVRNRHDGPNRSRELRKLIQPDSYHAMQKRIMPLRSYLSTKQKAVMLELRANHVRDGPSPGAVCPGCERCEFSVKHMFECASRDRDTSSQIMEKAGQILTKIMSAVHVSVAPPGKNMCIAVALGWTPSVTWVQGGNGAQIVGEVIQYDRMPEAFWEAIGDLYEDVIYFAGNHVVERRTDEGAK